MPGWLCTALLVGTLFSASPSAVVLISKLCPQGVESTVYALLAGFSNFGSAVASSLGVLGIDVAGIKTPGEGLCNFDNLSWLIVFSHVLLPLLTVPLTFVLIPNARMTDDLVGDLPTTGATGGDGGDEAVKGGDGSADGADGTGSSSGMDEGMDGLLPPGPVRVPPPHVDPAV